MYKKRLTILKNAIKAKGEYLHDNTIKVKLAGLEYSVHVAIIFNQHFMNKQKSVTLENIDVYEAVMKESLEYFSKWRQAAISKKKEDKEWEKACISAVTFNNLRVQVVGFFKFARNILKMDKTIWNVPFLYSNQSSLLFYLPNTIPDITSSTIFRYFSICCSILNPIREILPI